VAAHERGRHLTRLGLETEIVDRRVYDHAVARCRAAHVVLPTFAELAEPAAIAAEVTAALAGVDPDAPDPRNLFRVHWYNDSRRRGRATVPEHVVLPESLTGVRAPIAVVLGDRFPMIAAHKVLAAYGCLAPRLVTGQFDPGCQRALWPSTGNYCRGGVAISRIMGCRGVAILPAGMSAERFEWLDRWVESPEDVVRTPGSESNVKEIYDACAELERDPANVVFNQFCEFGNYLAHYGCTGAALARVAAVLAGQRPGLRPFAFVSATGSAGTLAAGDYLKREHGTRTVAVEALECPTLLYNGFGEHNIQGIGDKHVPYIHNVLATDAVTAISDRSTDALGLMFSRETGRRFLLERRGVAPEIVGALGSFGLSSLCNVLAAIKTAKWFDLGPEDLLLTVATDGAALYASEWPRIEGRDFPAGFDAVACGEVFGEHLAGARTDHYLELTRRDRERIFNLGYYTWVEQQGLAFDAFEARRRPAFWDDLHAYLPAWDERIREFNARVAARS
jgi:cysteine synthase